MATAAGAPDLDKEFADGVQALLAGISDPLERGMAFLHFGTVKQFYFNGNKRTSRFMMNGILISHGLDAISIPVRRREEFNEQIVRFVVERDATEMMCFLVDCQPDDVPLPGSETVQEDSADEGPAAENRQRS